jgi:cell fate regulator YaaT (PSP1 superfamily)
MPDTNHSVVGVRFRNAGRIFYFHSAGMRIDPGEYVVVETSRGPEVARVVIGTEQVVVNELGDEDLKPVLRLATDDDIRRADDLRARAQALLPEARRLAGEAGFPPHLDSAEFTLDGRRLTFSFTSEERVDYRDFLRKAAEQFAAKVDMRQMGARDRAKLAGGYGICGRELCCANWLTTFPSISIRMAKEQELPLNPQKISGLCGRLLCCLSYEEEGYKEMRRTLPKIGHRCSTPTGEGRVIAVNILRRQVTLVVEGQRIEIGDRDLGTVVRWDTSSKSGTPPPSITRAEAIAQGLIEATEEDLREPEPEPPRDWLSEDPGFTPERGTSRGRLPSREPRRPSSPRPPPAARESRNQGQAEGLPVPPGQSPGGPRRGDDRRRGGGQGGQRPPAGLQGPATSHAPAPVRKFERTQPPPAGTGPRPPQVGAAGEGTGEAQRPAGSRRRRRRGRGRGTDGNPATED